MKKTITTSILLFLLISWSFGQSYFTVSGVVKDSKSGEHLPFSSVGIAHQAFGTVSNEEGFFELHIPHEYAEDSLSISFVGYHPFQNLVKQLGDTTLEVNLHPKSELLDEVLVLKDNAAFARSLFVKAGKNINKNYSRRPFQMRGFYRGIYQQDGHYVRAEEAAVTIDSKGYGRHINTTLTRIDQLRKSEDGRVLNWKSALFNWLWSSNGVYDILKLEPIKIKQSPYLLIEYGDYFYTVNQFSMSGVRKDIKTGKFVFVKDKSNINYYDFRVTAITEYEGEKVYVVNYKNPYKESRFRGEGRLVISMETYAILDYQHKVFSPTAQYLTFNEGLISSIHVKYKKVGDTYTLQMIRLEAIGDDESIFSRKGDGGDKGRISQERILIITDTYTKRKDYERIKKAESLHEDTNIKYANTPYNPDFWRHYNIVSDTPMARKVLDDLEKQNLKKEAFRL